MNDPWKYLAFPAAAVAGFLVTETALTTLVQGSLGVSTTLADTLLVAGTGLIAGFMVDEVIPAYVEKVRNSRGNSAAGGMDDSDFDFE